MTWLCRRIPGAGGRRGEGSIGSMNMYGYDFLSPGERKVSAVLMSLVRSLAADPHPGARVVAAAVWAENAHVIDPRDLVEALPLRVAISFLLLDM